MDKWPEFQGCNPIYWSNKGQLLASATSKYRRTQLHHNSIEQTNPDGNQGNSLSPLNVLKVKPYNKSIFLYPNVKASTYIYYTRGALYASATDNGIIHYYFYDDYGRLKEIRDGGNKVLQRFTYHYSTGF